MTPLHEKVWAALKGAQRTRHGERPFGLFDYTSYGDPIPHHVRDFRDPSSESYGACVFRDTDPNKAQAECERLTQEHITNAILRAIFEGTKFIEFGGMPDVLIINGLTYRRDI